MPSTPDRGPGGTGQGNHNEHEERMRRLQDKALRKIQRRKRRQQEDAKGHHREGASTGKSSTKAATGPPRRPTLDTPRPAPFSITRCVSSAFRGIFRAAWQYCLGLSRRLLFAMAAIAALVCVAEGVIQGVKEIPVVGAPASWVFLSAWVLLKGAVLSMAGGGGGGGRRGGLPVGPPQQQLPDRLTANMPPSDTWTEVGIYPHALDMHRNIGFILDLADQGDGDDAPTLVAARIVNEAVSRNGPLGADGSAALDGNGRLVAGEPSPLRLVLSDTATVVAEMTQQDRLFVKDAAVMLRAIFRRGRRLQGILEEAVGSRDAAASAARSVPTLLRPFASCAVHVGTLAGRWMGREDQARKQAAQRLADLRDLLHHSIETHATLSRAFDVKLVNAAVEGEVVDIEARLCGVHHVLSQALDVGDYRLRVAMDARSRGGSSDDGERGVTSQPRRQDRSLTSVKTLGGAARQLLGIEAVGSVLCLQAKGSVAEFESRISVARQLQEDMIELRSRVNMLMKLHHPKADGPVRGRDVADMERGALDLLGEFLRKLHRAYVNGP
ncbi:hypothetical protein LY76DRAFT_338998 [Colletotrichum caudatum]|nr:hypothetical protein LY76DRAFT_338998 [Colletotrichum caudatum]